MCLLPVGPSFPQVLRYSVEQSVLLNQPEGIPVVTTLDGAEPERLSIGVLAPFELPSSVELGYSTLPCILDEDRFKAALKPLHFETCLFHWSSLRKCCSQLANSLSRRPSSSYFGRSAFTVSFHSSTVVTSGSVQFTSLASG